MAGTILLSAPVIAQIGNNCPPFFPRKFRKGRHPGLRISSPRVSEIAVDILVAPALANRCQVGAPHASFTLETVALYAAMFMKQERAIGRAAGNKKTDKENQTPSNTVQP